MHPHPATEIEQVVVDKRIAAAHAAPRVWACAVSPVPLDQAITKGEHFCISRCAVARLQSIANTGLEERTPGSRVIRTQF